MEQAVDQQHVGVGRELEDVAGVLRQLGDARVDQDQGGRVMRAARRVLDEAGGDRVVGGRVGADHDDDIGVVDVAHRVRYGARTDAFEQGRDRGGMAQPGAVVDVVVAEAEAHQLLEQVGLLVAALGRAEAGQRQRAVLLLDVRQAMRGKVQRLVPARLAELRAPVGGPAGKRGILGRAGAADQRHGEPGRMVRIVVAVTALDAEPAGIGRAVAAIHPDDAVVLDPIAELAADAAIGAERIHRLFRRRVFLRAQGAGRAGGDAFAAADAGTVAHRRAGVEDDLAARREADHVVPLDVAAGGDAAGADDAGVAVEDDRGVGGVDFRSRRG